MEPHKSLKRIYVCGRYSGTNVIEILQNIGKGERACAELFKLGFAPFSPWADRQYIFEYPYADFKVEEFKAASMAWVEVSDALYVISHSTGVQAEIDRANELEIPVFYDLDSLLDWRLTCPQNPIKRLQRLATPDNGCIIQSVCNEGGLVEPKGKIDPSVKSFLYHIIKCKERASRSGLYGFFKALCDLHEQAISNYLERMGV